MKNLKHKMFSLVLVLLMPNYSNSQNYTVDSYQKINELNGGFTGNLDNNDSFGVSVDNIGDLDGNGVNDLVVGAFGDGDGGVTRGAIWILFLDNDNTVISQTKISSTTGGFTGILDNDDRFGGAVAYLGDLNNDGLIEIAVGADYDGDGGFWHGAVWILSLNNTGTVNSFSKISDTQGNFTGFINGDAIFGTDIENIGDLNGDGIDDLAVGSRRDNDGGANEGAVWILFLNNDFTVNTYQKISDTQGNFNGTLDFEDYFGGSVANIGDLDGDGIVDIAVGTYRDDDQLINSGSFYILFLNSNGTVKSYQKISNLSVGLNSIISQEALFGESIDGVLDIDSDGKIEIVVGAMKQVNPTLSVSTGAFFIIELNSDGTVSEEHLYTFAENCFKGELNNGDLFGGSVSVLSNINNEISIVAGAYRDSENGYRKGAIWILNLGEIIYNIKTFLSPTSCDSIDGSITMSGLTAGLSYTINYDYQGVPVTGNYIADTNGDIIITGLDSGVYDNIVVIEDLTSCTDNLGQVVLDSIDLTLTISSLSPTTCDSIDGSITMSGLTAGLSYTINYDYQGVPVTGNYIADTNGEIIITGLDSGVYDNIVVIEDLTSCTDNLGQVVLDSIDLTLTISSLSPTTCGSVDGSIMISGLTTGLSYTINYDYQGVPITGNYIADTNGEIIITGLDSGVYDNIVVIEDLTRCTDNLGQEELVCAIDVISCFKVKKYFTPNNDGYNDFWSLDTISNDCTYILYIFDRYGKLLKTLTSQNNKWNGNYNGRRMPSSDYWFKLDYVKNGEFLTFRSHFALKR
jgi:gliding motility-associated-like protein